MSSFENSAGSASSSNASGSVAAATAVASSSSSSWLSTLTLASAGLAACGALALVAMQSDACSRRIMSADDLQVKRQNEYIYQWSQAFQRAKLQLQYYLAGCGNNNSRSTRNNKKSVAQYKANDELARTSFLSKQDEMKNLVDKIVSGKIQGLRVGRIGKDTQVSNEYFLWLIRQMKNDAVQGDDDNLEDYDAYQAPLGPFCLLLADAMERKITGTTFCFVSDASAGLASRLVVDLVTAATKGGTANTVATVEEPLWMACFAAILELGVLSSTTAERIMFALCRLEAAAVSSSSSTTTVLVTLPGQATTSALLPLLQTVFPDDRHVFCYTGCIRTLEHAQWLRRCRNPKNQRGYIPESFEDVLTLSQNPVIHTAPLLRSMSSSSSSSSSSTGSAADAAACRRRSPLVRSSNVMPPFLSALAALPIHQADTVETWMTAVDAFLALKENEKRNCYLPYVFKLDYLLSAKSSTVEINEGSDRYWSLVSLLQFVTGSKSRAMASEHIDAAASWLRERQEQPHPPAPSIETKSPLPPPVILDNATRKKVEQAVFQHKRILIENKTLLDTVQPKQHWTLKAALKKGCACCAPEDEEEEDEEEAGNTTMGSRTKPASPFGMGDTGSRTSTATKTTTSNAGVRGGGGYVDGKMGFAFDPTKFNT